MKILFACNSYPPHIGGAEKVCKNAVDILSEKHSVTILTQPHEKRKNMPNVIELTGKTAYSYMAGLKEFLDNNSFDLYISFGYGKHFTDAIGKWCKKHKKKSIVMPCGFFHTNSNALYKKIYSLLMTKWSLNNYDIRITATQWEKDFWARKFGVKKDNTFVVPYNLEKDFKTFEKMKNISYLDERLETHSYLLYMGRTGPNKLIELLIQSYYKSDQTLPLVIAGKGTEKYRDIFEGTKSDELKNIIFLGEVTEYGKKNLIENAYTCVFPSSYESFGMVLLESTALNTPVIGSDIGPFNELLDEKCLFNNNTEDLTKKLNEIYLKKPKVNKIKLPNYKTTLLTIIGDLIE